MEVFKVNQIIILFVLVSFAGAREIKSAVPNKDNKLNLECNHDSNISLLLTNNNSLWTDSFEVNCPNRSSWGIFGVSLVIVVNCEKKPNCSVDLSNVTITNCTNFQQYLNVKYTCNSTETTTETPTTTEVDPPDDDDDDDDSEEDRSTTTTTTTKKPPGRVEPNYLPNPVPGLITTPKPTRRPNHFPVPLIPVPAPRPMPQLPSHFSPLGNAPIFQHYPGNQGFNFPPIILPLPAPVPIPIFG